MRTTLAMIVVALLVVLAVLVPIQYFSDHSLAKAIRQAQVVSITLPDERTVYYLSKRQNMDAFAAFKRSGAPVHGMTVSKPACRIVIYAGASDGMSDEAAMKLCRPVSLTYYPEFGVLGVNDHRYSVSKSFYDWMKSRIQRITPVPPQRLSASVRDSAVNLTWTPLPGATFYRIYRGSAGGVYDTSFSSASPHYTDTTAVGRSEYFYAVTSANSYGESDKSTEIAVALNKAGTQTKAD